MRKKLKRFSSVLLLAIITIIIIPQSTYADSSVIQNNENIPSDWAKEEIDAAKEINLIPENIQGEYRSSITREEFCELSVKLYEALSGKEGTYQEANPFTDTENPKVIIANNLGIVNGIGNGKFDPNNMVTREGISVMVYRTLKVAKSEYDFSELYESTFSDKHLISSWAQEAVGYLYSVEIINGVGDNLFNPVGNTSREQAIVLVKRMYEKVLASENASLDKLIVTRGNAREKEHILKLKELIPQEIGKPYKWAATGPDSYDCSGLVYSLFGRLGISLPRTSKSQSMVGTYVAKENLVYGDLVFFARDGVNVNHAGIYVGNSQFVHAPGEGKVVSITTLTSGYFADKYYTARRILP